MHAGCADEQLSSAVWLGFKAALRTKPSKSSLSSGFVMGFLLFSQQHSVISLLIMIPGVAQQFDTPRPPNNISIWPQSPFANWSVLYGLLMYHYRL